MSPTEGQGRTESEGVDSAQWEVTLVLIRLSELRSGEGLYNAFQLFRVGAGNNAPLFYISLDNDKKDSP